MQETQIYLPLFGGFYDSIHQLDTDYIIEDVQQCCLDNEGSYVDIFTKEEIEKIKENKNPCIIQDIFDKYFDIDYKKYEDDYGREFTSVFNNYYGKELQENVGIELGDFVGISSPAYYNFDTDHINVNVKVDFNKVVDYLKANKEKFSEYIEKHNTSYDGFIAYGENKFDLYIDKEEFEAFELTQIIDFYLELTYGDDIDVINMHYDVESNLCVFNYINKIN